MKKRYITSLDAGGLMAAMLPGAAMAQIEAEGALTFAFNDTCDYGQDSPWELPPCETNEDTRTFFISFESPARMSGSFDGVSLRDGVADMVVEGEDNGDFTYTAQVVFTGTVEGCGAGTVYFEAHGEGVNGAGDIATYTSHEQTIVPRFKCVTPSDGAHDVWSSPLLHGAAYKSRE